jgi:hypothetical protein
VALHTGPTIVLILLSSICAGCPWDAPPLDLLDQLNYARVSIPQYIQLVEDLALDKASSFASICGNAPDLILEAADVVTNILCRVADNLREVRVFFRCDNVYPLYEGVAYDTVCYSGTEGFAWVASTQFVIVFMAMIILTLRITFYEVEAEDPEVKDQEVTEAESSIAEDEESGSSLDRFSSE